MRWTPLKALFIKRVSIDLNTPFFNYNSSSVLADIVIEHYIDENVNLSENYYIDCACVCVYRKVCWCCFGMQRTFLFFPIVSGNNENLFKTFQSCGVKRNEFKYHQFAFIGAALNPFRILFPSSNDEISLSSFCHQSGKHAE